MNAEPRSETIARHVREALATDGRLTERSYAEAVMHAYHAAVPLHLRRVPFELGATAEQVERAQRANAQAIHRFLNGETRMPVDLEEALVDALPQALRDRCIRALAARGGMLAVPMPTACGMEQMQRTAGLLHGAGDAVAAIAPMLADGVINQADRPHAATALEQLQRVITTATALHAQITAAMDTNVTTLRRAG